MRRCSSIAAVVTLLLATGCAGRAPARLRAASAQFGSPFSLPQPDTHGNMPLDEAISRRRSSRSFSPKPLPLTLIGQLLWAGQGITSPDGKRTAPSAGGLYPIELYVVTPHQVMHYLPAGHRVEVRADVDHRGELARRRARTERGRERTRGHRRRSGSGTDAREVRRARRHVRRARSRTRDPEHPPRGNGALLGCRVRRWR